MGESVGSQDGAAVRDATRQDMGMEQRHGVRGEHAIGAHVRGGALPGPSGAHRGRRDRDSRPRRPHRLPPIMSARRNPTCRIIAFEAQEPMFRLLQKNLQENCIPNVDARNVAVGDVCDPASVGITDFVEDLGVVYPNWAYGGSGMFNLGGIGVCAPTGTHVSAAAHVVPMVSIDSLELPRVDYMKIDVEGCEPLVLLGAQETIKRCKPVILFECTEKRPHQRLLDYFGLGPRDAVPESAQLLRNLGYNSFSALPGYNWLAMVIDSCSHN